MCVTCFDLTIISLEVEFQFYLTLWYALVMKLGEFGIEEVYVPSESLGKTEVEALDESEKLVEKYMEYAAKETKVSTNIVQL